VVSYDAGYGAAVPGTALTIPGLTQALYLAHTNDNTGPPLVTDIEDLHALLSERYPGATIKATTLDAFAEKVWEVRDRLPVLKEEIGDSWIHGVASDPLQVARFRELLRLRDRWINDGRISIGSADYNAFSDNLLLVAEHTWGKDLKRFLPDFENYAKVDFQRARARDTIEPRLIPEIHGFLAQWSDEAKKQGYSYSAFENSWVEQRQLVESAIGSLTEDKQVEARTALLRLSQSLAVDAGRPISRFAKHSVGRFTVEFGDDGSITSLVDSKETVWADSDNSLAAYRYQTFGAADFEDWIHQYCRDIEVNGYWAYSDFGKPGLENVKPAPQNRKFRPHVREISRTSIDDDDVVSLEMGMPDEATEIYGAPHHIRVRYVFSRQHPTLHIEIELVAKDASRLPEASWLSFAPKVNNPNLWTMDKISTTLSPLSVVRNGNRNLHALRNGLRYEEVDRKAEIVTWDAPVVSVGQARLLSFDNSFADLACGFHFNLHNNVWGTNFRMWFEDDMKYRFTLTLR
jgi:hypothetical protein